MAFEEVTKEFGFTAKSLRILVSLGVIRAVPTEHDRAFLALLSRVWKNRDWLRESLRQVRSKARREKLLRELELTKPERYVLNRYLNAGGRLSLQRVACEVANYYGLPENTAKGIVKRIRSRAYMSKNRRRQERVRNGQAKGL